jgi:hypothetical protein
MIPRLQTWSDRALRRVCDACEVFDYLPGDKVTEENDVAEAVYVLMRGRLQIYVPYLVDRPEATRSGSPLTVVDEHCLFDRGEVARCQNTVLALECSELLRIDRQGFQEVVQVSNIRRSQVQLRRAVDRDGHAFPWQIQPRRSVQGGDMVTQQRSATSAFSCGSDGYVFADQSPCQTPIARRSARMRTPDHNTVAFFLGDVDRDSSVGDVGTHSAIMEHFATGRSVGSIGHIATAAGLSVG